MKVMAKRRVMLSFSAELLIEPITYNLGQQFNLVTNILRAEVTEEGGWLILEIEGKDGDIEAGITWAISRGARIDSVNEETP